MRPVSVLPVVVIVCVLASACASGADENAPKTPSPGSSSTSPEPSPEPTADPVVDPQAPLADLHLDCAGEGDPTVVLVAGLNTSGDTFSDLQRRLSGTARTCFYDRAGIGDSSPLDPAAPDPSPGSAAADLSATLSAAGIEPPYVLLGWSYGGLVTQAYAADFPDDVTALVLEDTSVREQFTAGGLADPSFTWKEGGRTVDTAKVRTELTGLDLRELPVVALSQDGNQRWMPSWYRSHDRLARSTSDGVHAIGLGSGHAMHQDVFGLVVRAIEVAWTAASDGTGLPDCREVFRGEKVRCRV